MVLKINIDTVLKPPKVPFLSYWMIEMCWLDITNGANGSTGRDVEAAGHCDLRPPAGAHHHALHRLPRPHILLLRHLHGGEGGERQV